MLARSPSFCASSIICARQPRSCWTSTSGRRSANGSWPTSSRAHHTAWPSPSGSCWRVKLVVPGAGRSRLQEVERRLLLALEQRHFELELAVEMILDDAFVAAGDEDEMLDAGLAGLVDDVLDQRPVDDRQHLLRHGLGGGQKPCAEPGDRENRFAYASHDGPCGEREAEGKKLSWRYALLPNLLSKEQGLTKQRKRCPGRRRTPSGRMKPARPRCHDVSSIENRPLFDRVC